jgi:hypothetical protein
MHPLNTISEASMFQRRLDVDEIKPNLFEYARLEIMSSQRSHSQLDSLAIPLQRKVPKFPSTRGIIKLYYCESFHLRTPQPRSSMRCGGLSVKSIHVIACPIESSHRMSVAVLKQVMSYKYHGPMYERPHVSSIFLL